MEKSEKTTFKAISLSKFKGKLEVKEFDLPKELKAEEILVKVMCSTIMPADLALLQGNYGSMLPETPFIPGMEGSGIIEKVGESIDKTLIGKHVSIIANSSQKSYNGLWAQYTVTTLLYLIVFQTKIDFDRIFNSQGNPLTALGFIDTMKKAGKKSVAHNGASSAFGRMFMRLCISQGIEVLNIVRKEQSVKELSELGGKHFINTSDKDWESKLKQKCEELDISILFDCCGGKYTGKCLTAIKPYGVLYHFGNLELSRLSEIDSKEMIWNHKKIEGWWMLKFLLSLKIEEVDSLKDFIRDDLEKNNGNLFSTDYNTSFTLDQVEKAFEVYLTEGKKVLFKPWENK